MPDLTASQWNPPQIVLIGAGMDIDTFKRCYAHWLARAEVVITGAPILQELTLPENVKVLEIKPPVLELVKKLDRLAQKRRVLVIASGDPLFFGIGRLLSKHLDHTRLKIIPNITAVQYLFARLKIPWDDVKCLSLHGSAESREFFFWLRLGKKVALLTDPVNNPTKIAEILLQHNFRACQLAIGEALGSDREKVTVATPEEAFAKHWNQPNIVAILPYGKVNNEGGFFDEAQLSHQAGLITKREIRAVVLAMLRLNPGNVLWDIGAGSGSVSIEACYSTPLARVYAVEKNPTTFKHLVNNVAAFHCGEIEAVQEDAVDAVNHLPEPDRIFIGGGGKDLPAILEGIHNRLQGRVPLVLTTVLWDSLENVKNFAKSKGYNFSAVQVDVQRSKPISGSFRFDSLNPVFIVHLER